jgi:hypothetical protein
MDLLTSSMVQLLEQLLGLLDIYRSQPNLLDEIT